MTMEGKSPLPDQTDLPDGQISDGLRFCPVQPQTKKYFCFSEIKSVVHPSRPVPNEGRIAIVTDVGSGMWWTRQRWARDVIAGRVSRERLTAR
jgi:hypothetical protein